MSNKLKLATIVVITSAVILGSVLVYNSSTANSKANQKMAQYISSLSSSSESESTSSSSSSLNISISSESTNLLSQTAGSETPQTQIQNSTKMQNGLKVEYIDVKNPPKYIQDYFDCGNKDRSKYDIGFYYDNEIRFRCPKDIEYYGCKTYVVFNPPDFVQSKPAKEGYSCDPKFGFEKTRGTCFEIDRSIKFNQVLSPILFQNSYDVGENCISFITEKLTNDEKDILLSSTANKLKLILIETLN